MKINKFTKRGMYHTRKREENQDCVVYKQTDDVVVAAIADGATRCKYGAVGARIACETAIELLLSADFFEFEKIKIAFVLFEEIAFKIKEEAEKYGQPVHVFGSTLIVVCYDKKKHRILTVNLGDGSGFIKKEGKYSIFLPPQRYNGRCVLTPNKEAYKYATVDVRDVSDVSSVFICSDGVIEIVDKKHADIESLIDNADSFKIMDDFSFIEINMG